MQQTDLPAAEYRHVYEFYIRFGDIDSQGHVNNVKFLGYLEDARLEMFHGDPVRKGDVIARIHPVDRTGQAAAEYRAALDGILAARHFPGLVKAGDCLAVIGTVE